MLKKLISGTIIALLVTFSEWYSPFLWFIVVCAIAILGNYELQKIIEEKKYQQSYKLITTFIILFLFSTYVVAYIPIPSESILDDLKLLLIPQNYLITTHDWRGIFAAPITVVQNFILGIAFVLIIIVNLNYKPRVSIGDLSFVFTRIIYLGFFPSYMILLRAMPDGHKFLLAMLFSCSFSDMFAYFTGKAIGKTPFVQEISPNKTVEGAIGGAISCIACFMTFGYFLIGIPWYHSLILGAMISITAPMGDLIESLFKRDVGKKDSGTLIPGHGGILDRVDSYIFTSFPVYFYILWAIYN
ncbi:MAG: phosphatidate cytidylyltransferase [Candidatus Sericytochromatia bacterium]|nr:phosphatidate cytidylyltransferase [Candidatus Sericytochromatia bacterium]